MTHWNLNLTILLTTLIINAGLLSMVIFYHLRNLRQSILIAFFGSGICFILWFIANYLADEAADTRHALLWTRLTIPPSLLGLWFFLWFSSEFPIKKEKIWLSLTSYLAAIFLLSGASLDNLVFKSVTLQAGNGVTNISTGLLYPFMIVLYLLLIIEIFWKLFSDYKKADGSKKMQVKYLIMGWA